MKLLPLLLPLAFLAPITQAAVTPKVLKAETKAFARADKDGDEAISYGEFKALLKPLAVALEKFPATGRGDDPEELLELCGTFFVWFDADENGAVTFDEWLALRQEADLEFVPDLLNALPGLDRNGNGRARLNEFLPLVKCYIPLRQAKSMYSRMLAEYGNDSGEWGAGFPGTPGGPPILPPGLPPTETGLVETHMGDYYTDISAAWAQRDPAAVAAWVAWLLGPETNRPIPTLPEGTEPEEGERRGRR